jgi:tetratricopeptide (TPR) repeat protein
MKCEKKMKAFKKVTLFCLPYFLVACSTIPTSGSDSVSIEPSTSQQPLDQPQEQVKVTPVNGAVKANVVVLSLLDRAQQQELNGDEQAAEASLERAIRIAPRYPKSYFRLALLRYKQGRYDQACSLAEKSLSLGADEKLYKLAHNLLERASAAL